MTATEGLETPVRPATAIRQTMARMVGWIALLGRPPRSPAPRLLPAARSVGMGAVLAVLAVGAAMVFVDARTFAALNLLPPPLVDLFNEITDYGKSGWFLWPSGLLIVALALIAGPALGRVSNLVIVSLAVRLEFLFIAVAAPGLLITIAKRLIGRVRPSELGPFAYEPFSWRADYAGLPSGHSTSAFAAAIAIGVLWPRTRPFVWIYAVIIALSRVIIGAHYPSDVIAGAFVGAFGALVVRNIFAARRRGLVVGPDGAVRVLPGPSMQRLKRVAARVLGH